MSPPSRPLGKLEWSVAFRRLPAQLSYIAKGVVLTVTEVTPCPSSVCRGIPERLAADKIGHDRSPDGDTAHSAAPSHK